MLTSIPLPVQQAADTPVGSDEPAAELEAEPVAELAAVGDTGGLDSSTDMGTAACATVAASLQQAVADADIAVMGGVGDHRRKDQHSENNGHP